ncbi:MAG: hypothetical protein BVN33_16935 [Proteobacteria bacterium ST_bin13]|nr:MAG: hypothetical protein BVN33_16935 [Proteobacteria bacterium ST_bin13]
MQAPFPQYKITAATIAASLALGGCAGLPPLPGGLPSTPAAFRIQPATDGPAVPVAAEGHWWAIFADPVLDHLVAQAEARNDTIAIAVANLDRARADLRNVRADQAPQLVANASVARGAGIGGQPIATQPGPNSLSQGGVELSYEVDLFGRLRQRTRAAALDARSQAELLRNARLLVQAQVATTYSTLRAIDDESAVLDNTISSYERTRSLIAAQVAEGERGPIDLDRADGQLSNAQGERAALRGDRASLANALAALVGEPASTFEVAPQPPLVAPPLVPAGLPSEVLERRPDIAAAQQAMLAAQARVGVARAQWFPSLALTARGGGASADLGSMLANGAQVWSVGALLAGTLFDGGRRAADVARARADLDRSFAEYRGTVLGAFRDVETQLSALQTLGQERADRERAVAAYARATTIAKAQYRNGETGQLELFDTQRNELIARRRLVQIVGAQHQATALLIRALGGGWPTPVSAS